VGEELENTCNDTMCKTLTSLALRRDHKIATIIWEKRELYIKETTTAVGDEEIILILHKQHQLICLSVRMSETKT
jgi:hypothetical protein